MGEVMETLSSARPAVIAAELANWPTFITLARVHHQSVQRKLRTTSGYSERIFLSSVEQPSGLNAMEVFIYTPSDGGLGAVVLVGFHKARFGRTEWLRYV